VTEISEPHSLNFDSCILFSTADWDARYWTNKQHLAVDFARRGMRVLYVESVGIRVPKLNSRLDFGRIIKRLFKAVGGPRAVDENLFVLSPLAIPFLRRSSFIRAMNNAILKYQISKAQRVLEIVKPLLWTYHPYLPDVFGQVNSGFIYHCVDDISAVPGVDGIVFNQEEDSLVKRVDMIFVTSRALEARFQAMGKPVHFLSNVVDFDHFASARTSALPQDFPRVPSPVVGYVGVLSDFKVDFNLVLEAVRLRPHIHWVLIGDEREGQSSEALAKMRQMPNVALLGYKPYAQLPSYLAGFDVAALPTLINEYTRSMFPMKYFEYVAAGLPVVATPLEFLKESSLPVAIAQSAEEFIDAVESKAKVEKYTREESRVIVAENTWTERSHKMLSMVSDHLLQKKRN